MLRSAVTAASASTSSDFIRRASAEPVAGANDGWPSQFRFAGDVGCSVMAQLRMFGQCCGQSRFLHSGLQHSYFLTHSRPYRAHSTMKVVSVAYSSRCGAPSGNERVGCSQKFATCTRLAEQVAGANDGWPSQFRFAGDVGCSVMAQLRMLGANSRPSRKPLE